MGDTEPAHSDAIAELVAEVAARRSSPARRLPPARSRRLIRERAGVSKRRVARTLCVSPMSVVRWEQGATPRPEHAGPYCELLEALQEAST